MDATVGITRHTFLTMGTYLCVVVFHSSSLLSSAAAILSVLAVQAAAYLIFPAIAKLADKKLMTFVTVLFTAVMGVLIYRLYGILPISGISVSFLPFQDPVFLLVLVPLLMDQAQYPDKYPLRFVLKQAGLFAGMMLFVSFIREILGYGTLPGTRIFAEGLQPMPLMAHTAGAAFLILLLMLSVLYLYRRITGTRQVLSVIEDSGTSSKQPVLIRKQELEYLYSALYCLLITATVMISLYLLSVFVLPADIPFDIILMTAVVLQGMMMGLVRLLSGRNNPNISRILLLPWLIPVQTLVLLIPYSQEFRGFLTGKGTIHGLVGLLFYLACSWIFAVSLLLFIRSVIRRLLFGKRPEILSGLPLLLLFTGLGLMVLAGFAAIPYNMMLK
ncbi:MAG: hypothetical protein WCG21_13160 [Eubacteriales bacterium]